MQSSRLEAFSDAILAIVITIMVLQFQMPKGPHIYDLLPLLPKLLAYTLSYFFVILYWINHHHILLSVKLVNAKIIWANVIWLFFMSFIPFTTSWVSKYHMYRMPSMVYGILLLFTGMSYVFLQKEIYNMTDEKDQLGQTIGQDKKGTLSLALCSIGIILSFFSSHLAMACYLLTAIFWFVQDKVFSKVITTTQTDTDE